MTQDLITIAITCYNAQDSIARAIDSALSQDWPNKEIIVFDDCSSDNSKKIIQSYAEKGVRYLTQDQNIGPGGARANLVNNANGEFVAFFDDDDISAPHRISAQYNRIIDFEQKNGQSMIACYANGQRHYGETYSIDLNVIGQSPIEPHGPAVAENILCFTSLPQGWCGGAMPSCALMARKNVFVQLGNFDPNFRRVEDLDFAVRLALAGGYFIGCDEKLITQYATTGNDKTPDKNLRAEQQLAKKHADYLKPRGLYYHAYHWPELRHYHFTRDYRRFAMCFFGLFMNAPIKTMTHFLKTAFKRYAHEKKITKAVTTSTKVKSCAS